MAITVMTAVGFVAALSTLLATLLLVASRKLYVYEDPRIDTVDGMLPHSNCGACGFAGCRAFAEALVEGKTNPSKCTVSNDQERDAIADYLHVESTAQDRLVARLACAGGNNVARIRAIYRGEQTCRAATQVVGGGKSCTWGCLGYGDCAEKCTFDAISMNEHGLPVVDEDKCTACGDCIVSCPKDLFSLQSIRNHLWVACKNEELGEHLLEHCQVACTACGRCAMDAPNNLIQMVKHLPQIDPNSPQTIESQTAIERCPTGAIIWIDAMGSKHGAAAKTPIRHSALPPEFS